MTFDTKIKNIEKYWEIFDKGQYTKEEKLFNLKLKSLSLIDHSHNIAPDFLVGFGNVNSDILIIDQYGGFFSKKNKKDIDSEIETNTKPVGDKTYYQNLFPIPKDFIIDDYELKIIVLTLLFRLVEIIKPKIVAFMTRDLLDYFIVGNKISRFSFIENPTNYTIIFKFENKNFLLKKIDHPFTKKNKSDHFSKSIKYLVSAIAQNPFFNINNKNTNNNTNNNTSSTTKPNLTKPNSTKNNSTKTNSISTSITNATKTNSTNTTKNNSTKKTIVDPKQTLLSFCKKVKIESEFNK